MKPKLRMESTDEYEKLVKFFIENELEFSEEEPVPTDLVQCWQIVHGDDRFLAGAVVLARREGEFIIDGIAVDKTYRKLKIGKIMLDKAIDKVRELGGSRLYLVARAPGFFRKAGFTTIERDDAPEFFECFTCPQYNVSCHPEVMMLEV
ncbi:MAG: GNAT family N-acetyltransferase [Eubacteriaceae bacterium]|nr:GNAT family N-acetyltransferase [Eubacteriaceae bacterium]